MKSLFDCETLKLIVWQSMYREWCDFDRLFVCNKFVVSRKSRILIFVFVVNFFFVSFIFLNLSMLIRTSTMNTCCNLKYVICFVACALLTIIMIVQRRQIWRDLSMFFFFANSSSYSFVWSCFLLRFFLIFTEFFCVYSYEYHINYLLISQYKSFYVWC